MMSLSNDAQKQLSDVVDNLAASTSLEMDSYERSRFYRNILEIRVMIGHVDKARETIPNISDTSERISSAEWMADELVSRGEIDLAMEVADDIFELSYKSSVIANAAKYVYSNISLASALAMVDEISNPETRWETCLFLCRAEAKCGSCDSALNIAKKIEFPSFRAHAFLAVAECYEHCYSQSAKAIKFSDILEIAHKVEDHLERASIFLDLSKFLISKSCLQQAKPTLQMSASFASMIEDSVDGLEALLKCGFVQLSILDVEGANKTAMDISFTLEYVDWSYGKATTLRGSLLAFSSAVGQSLKADECYGFSSEVFDLLEASTELVNAGLGDKAIDLAERAADRLTTIDLADVEMIAGGFSHASLAKGDLDHAMKLVQKVERINGSISITITDICEISEFMSKNVGKDQAIEYLQAEVKKIPSIPIDCQELAYTNFIQALENLGENDCLEECRQALAKLPIEYRSDTNETEIASWTEVKEEIERTLLLEILAGNWSQTKMLLETMDSVAEKARLLSSALKRVVTCGKV